MKKTALAASITFLLSGCINSTSMVKEVTGAKEGELPVFQQAGFTQAQAEFRQKLQQYHNSKQLPADTSTFSNCEIKQSALENLSGFTQAAGQFDSTKEDKGPKKSLASRIGQDTASAAGSSTQQSYHWQGGALYATATDCQKLVKNTDAGDVNYLIDSKYIVKTTAANFNGSHSITTKAYTHRVSQDHSESISLTSTVMGDDFTNDLGTKFILTMSNLEDPIFTYTYKNGADLLMMTESPTSPGMYFTTHFLTLEGDDNRVRSNRYTGSVHSGVGRTVNGKPHGLFESYGKYASRTCFENGEVVQTSDCDAF
jgi:hypothetical protein